VLKETFTKLAGRYSVDQHLITTLWAEIKKNYSGKKRHYHTLNHLHHLLQQLVRVKNAITQWDDVLFSLYYHDIVYNALKSDNEEKSADLAEKRLRQLSVPNEIVSRCHKLILATKGHHEDPDADINYFIDADLSILGQPWDIYEKYFRDIRKEYSIYPSLIYNPGRKKVLQHFLSMNNIFKTDFFFEELEERAKKNMQRELELLSSGET
jgi:predicted metal-dependent HD superfamily phosphohydrolase